MEPLPLQENYHQHNWHLSFTAYDATATNKRALTEVTFNVPVRQG
ncbi:hypothetical protein [Spirosoma endophyticum]|nr:hypothetical protein [Spirosoma endophyticum]